MKIKRIIFIVVILLIISFGYYFLNYKYDFSIPCIFNKVTGFYCPGCGVTRMIFSLLKLDIYQAFRYNPLVFILLIGGSIYIFLKIIILPKNIKINAKITYLLLIIVILFGILRNISFFDFLAPTVL